MQWPVYDLSPEQDEKNWEQIWRIKTCKNTHSLSLSLSELVITHSQNVPLSTWLCPFRRPCFREAGSQVFEARHLPGFMGFQRCWLNSRCSVKRKFVASFLTYNAWEKKLYLTDKYIEIVFWFYEKTSLLLLKGTRLNVGACVAGYFPIAPLSPYFLMDLPPQPLVSWPTPQNSSSVEIPETRHSSEKDLKPVRTYLPAGHLNQTKN